jgi:hypothetical protein
MIFVLAVGWDLFLETNRNDLGELGYNNGTSPYKHTGMFPPFNPFESVWMEAIKTLLGTGVEKNEK